MEKVITDPSLGVRFVVVGILLCALLLPVLIAHFRNDPIIRLRDRMAKKLIRKYNRGTPLSLQEQILLNFFLKEEVITRAYLESISPKHYRLMLNPKAGKL